MDQLGIVREFGVIDIDELPKNEELLGPDPVPGLVQATAAWGNLPRGIVINGNGRRPYRGREIVFGRRQIKAARRAVALAVEGGDDEAATIARKVFFFRVELDDLSQAVIAAQENYLRHSNPVTEFLDFTRMLSEGKDDRDIAKITGVPVQTVRRRLRLRGEAPDFKRGGVTKELLALFLDGAIKFEAAYSARALPVEGQRKLVKWYHSDENAARKRITMSRVRSARSAREQAGAASVTSSLSTDGMKPPELGDRREAESSEVKAALIEVHTALRAFRTAGVPVPPKAIKSIIEQVENIMEGLC